MLGIGMSRNRESKIRELVYRLFKKMECKKMPHYGKGSGA